MNPWYLIRQSRPLCFVKRESSKFIGKRAEKSHPSPPSRLCDCVTLVIYLVRKDLSHTATHTATQCAKGSPHDRRRTKKVAAEGTDPQTR